MLSLYDDQKSIRFISLSEKLVLKTTQSSTVHESTEKKNTTRRNLCLGEKIRAVQRLEINPNYGHIGFYSDYRGSQSHVSKKSEEKILLQELEHESNSVRCSFFAKLLATDNKLMELLSFSRSQRLPVTRSLLQ